MPVLRTLLLAGLLAAATTPALAAISATVYKSPTCGCCEAYIAYLQQNGFQVTAINRDDMPQLKQKLGVTPGLESCHTARIAGYSLEGHVPVAAIRKLLASKPRLVGLSVPGMPANSPGMGPEKPGSLAVYSMTRSPQPGSTLYGNF
ncbi:DUF411 domain-containing protein [Vogesella sp. LIG4]|uniref:DUF411 domain-containing protein n=1 Tax=Vogesella sp. LIG4 TaxID=1192162 RepID=UPI00082018DC|nr:DUF411 domain-containing protein [Vogesella sp. LIG4]SCK26107.1 Uncharacterized conserved protein [Vogesella sp. LIG4]